MAWPRLGKATGGELLAEFRFYAELADFLPAHRRGRVFRHDVSPTQSVKHVIEALGVPHTEIGLLLVNGNPATLDERLETSDRVAIYPALSHLMPPAHGGCCRFAADAHLGRLARYLRFAGFDTLWDNAWKDADLVAVATEEERVVLTRDRDLLMHRALLSGCYVRGKDTMEQLTEITHRYALDLLNTRAGRCLECNDRLRSVVKAEVEDRLPPAVKAAFDEFWFCDGCRRVFWRGSHWRRMHQTLAAVAQRVVRPSDRTSP